MHFAHKAERAIAICFIHPKFYIGCKFEILMIARDNNILLYLSVRLLIVIFFCPVVWECHEFVVCYHAVYALYIMLPPLFFYIAPPSPLVGLGKKNMASFHELYFQNFYKF